MMLIPQKVSVRQVQPLLPSTYCSPQCPSCRTQISVFDPSTSCVANSSFITNCSNCQQCIITYGIQEGISSTTNELEVAMIKILNLCSNSTASTQVQALQSQASALSVIGDFLSSASSGGAGTSTVVITSVPPATSTISTLLIDNYGDGSSVATMTSMSATYSTMSTSPTSNNTLNFLTPTGTPISELPVPTSSAAAAITTSRSSVWIAGPVMGSVLGLCAILTIIIFTRRGHSARQAHQSLSSNQASPTAKKFPHSASQSRNSSFNSTSQTQRVSVPLQELQSIEVHELPAVEPVGSELLAYRSQAKGGEACEEDNAWPIPLPLGPLPLLFAMSELRDQREALRESPKHETFYHP